MQRIIESDRSACLAFFIVSFLFLGAFPPGAARAGDTSEQTPTARGFLENRGQIDPAVKFYAAGDRSAVYFTTRGIVVEIRGSRSPAGDNSVEPLPEHPTRGREQRTRSRAGRLATAIRFVDARASIAIRGSGQLSAKSHFLTGNAPERWRSNVRSYERVVYHEVWPGVDLAFRIVDGGIAYEILAQSGADLDAVRFTYEGGKAVELSSGELRLDTPLGRIVHRTASSDRTGLIRIAGDRESSAEAQPAEASGPSTAATPLSPLAPGDPQLGVDIWWSTFLGGLRDDTAYAVAVEDGVRPIVTGMTTSTDFPTTLGVVDSDYNSSFDVFVTKFTQDGSTVLWSTYLGGSNDDRGWAIAIDDSGRPVVAGVTGSPDYPVTAGAFDTSFNADYDAYVTKLSADGASLVWSSYYGGDDREWDVSGLDLAPGGRAILTGSTRSSDLPTSAGAYGTSLGGTQDAFVAALSADGSTLDFGTYLGGLDRDAGEDVTIDSTGRPLVVGSTSSADFPVTAGAFQTLPGGARDGFVTKLATDAGSLVFSTFLGGTGDDDGYAVVLDDSDRVLLTGATTSPDFPVTAGVFGSTYSGGADAFVSRLSATGATQILGTYFGGTGDEKGLDIVEDSDDRPIFAGWTCSADFPLAGPPINPDHFTCDGYLARLSPDWSVPLFSSYLGGWRDDSVFALALAEPDRMVAVGETYSPGSFPTTSNAFDETHNSPHTAYDAFVMKLLTPQYCTFVSGTADPYLLVGLAVDGNCPVGVPEGQLIDLVEGRLENLDAVDVGSVSRIACNSPLVVFGTDLTPPPGFALFQVARFKPDGTYSDGAETGLVGNRTIVAGDCP